LPGALIPVISALKFESNKLGASSVTCFHSITKTEDKCKRWRALQKFQKMRPKIFVFEIVSGETRTLLKKIIAQTCSHALGCEGASLHIFSHITNKQNSPITNSDDPVVPS
jgi:hypothetical protein